jgi:hypothetical protein
MVKDYFRYALPHHRDLDKELIFFPYWRFKGMLFFCGPSGIAERFVDVSHQAIESSLFPVSVGVRSQAMKLRFATPDIPGRFLQPSQSFKNISDNFQTRFGRQLPRPVLHQCHIGETLSLIYAPFYVKSRLYDAILDKAISPVLPADFSINDFDADNSDRHINFVSTLCPRCGWNLEGQRDSLVLCCKNCNSAWYPVGKKFKQLKFAQLPGAGDDGLYLPFWRVRAEVTGLNLNSYADMARIANLPRVAQSDWQDIAFRFWIPAFKVRPRVFLRLASHVTLSQPREGFVSEIPGGRIHSSTLPLEEALQSLKITLASFMKPRRTLMEKIQEIDIKAVSYSLMFLAFQEDTHEFIQPDFKLAINKNVLALSTNL